MGLFTSQQDITNVVSVYSDQSLENTMEDLLEESNEESQ
jgi:hypothetical protein